MNTLDPKRLALALGFTFGLGMLFLGALATYTGWGAVLVELIGTVYIGYSATLIGSFFGFGWGFVDGFIGGLLIAWLYNKVG